LRIIRGLRAGGCGIPAFRSKRYEYAVAGRWKIDAAMPEYIKDMVVYGTDEIEKLCETVDFVFAPST
jgi:aspartate-semialdehyde dehydrogenase